MSTETNIPEGYTIFDASKVKVGDTVYTCRIAPKVISPSKRTVKYIGTSVIVLGNGQHEYTYNKNGERDDRMIVLKAKPQPQIPADPPKGWQVLTDEAIEHPERHKFIERDLNKTKLVEIDGGNIRWESCAGTHTTNSRGRCTTGFLNLDIFCKPKRRKWKKFVNVHPDGEIVTIHDTKKDAEICSDPTNISTALPVTIKERRVKE